jgi:Fic family protein
LSQICRIIDIMSYKILESLGIPTEITLSDEILHWLMKIGECRPFFAEHLGSPLEVDLLRKAQVRAITYSNQIEGNSLDEGSVDGLMDAPKSSQDAEALEIQNYRDALQFVEELATDSRQVTQRDFCDMQRLVTSGLIREDQLGRYRTIRVSIANANNKNEIIDTVPEPHFVPEAMDELWRWLQDNQDRNPFVRAFAFHFLAVAVHPFADGNGRTVRLMQHLLLLKSGEKVARFVPSETAIMRTRDSYYFKIRQVKKLGDLAPMVEYLAKCFYESALQATEEGRQLLNSGKKLSPTERREAIIHFAKSTGEFTISQLQKEHQKVTRRTLERDLEHLIKAGAIAAIGQNKGRRYLFVNA